MGCHLVVQSSRSGYGPLNLALFDLGMVPWAGLSRGRATDTSFGSLLEVLGSFFGIILGSFWDHVGFLGGPWGVPGGSLGGPESSLRSSCGSPGVSGTGTPKSIQSV